MSKFATKAAANMFCQARYEAAKSNERLSSREGAAEEIGIDRTRLARIELGSTIPYQEEVLLMADCYKAPELKGNYCREMCPLGKNMPKIENAGLDRISLRMLSSLKKINEATLPYASKSGGEKVKASLAVILALSEIKATAAGIQLGMLFIDEPPFLDDEGAQAYVDALETIRNRYSDVKIMAITHDDAMKARFGQAVTVIKTDDGSKVIY